MLVGDPGARDGAVTFPLHRHGGKHSYLCLSFTHSFNKILLSGSFQLVCDVFVLVSQSLAL